MTTTRGRLAWAGHPERGSSDVEFSMWKPPQLTAILVPGVMHVAAVNPGALPSPPIDPLTDSDFVVGFTLEDGVWTAVDNIVGEYGEGATPAQAVHDLMVTLFEARDLLKGHRDDLQAVLKRELQYLEGALKDEML